MVKILPLVSPLLKIILFYFLFIFIVYTSKISEEMSYKVHKYNDRRLITHGDISQTTITWTLSF